MRVICIEDSVIIDEGPDKGTVITHKGSIYHVTGSIDGQELGQIKGINFAPGPWYEFLEVKGFHHYVRFLELPDDLFEIEQSKTTEYGRI